MISLLLAAAGVTSAVDAEHAFAKQAATEGQWTAFRAWSTDDALIFAPQPTNAHDALKNLKDPPEALKWAPSESYVSCDGGHAVNYGPWSHETRKAFGFFTTVWVRQADRSWKWVYDGGGDLAKPESAPTRPKVVKAACGTRPPVGQDLADEKGHSADRTLRWAWTIDTAGTRHFVAQLWNGKAYATVLDQTIKAS